MRNVRGLNNPNYTKKENSKEHLKIEEDIKAYKLLQKEKDKIKNGWGKVSSISNSGICLNTEYYSS